MRCQTQRVTMWECWIMTSNTNLTFFFFFFSDMSRDLFPFVVVKMMGRVICYSRHCAVGNIDNGKEPEQNLVAQIQIYFSIIRERWVSNSWLLLRAFPLDVKYKNTFTSNLPFFFSFHPLLCIHTLRVCSSLLHMKKVESYSSGSRKL